MEFLRRIDEWNFSRFRNEREGIRADLLSLVDATVEIPQAGVIRSLNVHVSGALCISEYARKYLPLVK